MEEEVATGDPILDQLNKKAAPKQEAKPADDDPILNQLNSAVPLKKKDESVSPLHGGSASTDPGKPSEKSTPKPTLSENQTRLKKLYEFEFNDWADRRHKEIQAQVEKDPSKLEPLNDLFKQEQKTKLESLNKDFNKFSEIQKKREAEYGKKLGHDVVTSTLQTINSGLSDQLPKEYFVQRLRMSKGSFGDLFDPRSDINAFGDKLPSEINRDEFNQWNNKQKSDVRSSSYDKRAELFLKEKLGKSGFDRLKSEFLVSNEKERVGFEQAIQEQNIEAEHKMRGIVQDLRDVHGASDFLNFAGNMVGQAAYRAPTSILSGSIGSIVSESAAVYDSQLDKIAEDKGLTREEVVKQGLDKPAEGQVIATLLGGLDAASAGTMLGLFRQAAAKELKKNVVKEFAKGFAKSAAVEGGTEVVQTEGEEFAAAKGAGTEYETDPWRVATAGVGGMIGGGVLGGSSTLNSDADISLDVKPRDITAEVKQIQQSIDPNNPGTIELAAQQIEQEVNKPQANEEVKTEPVGGTDPSLVLPETTEEKAPALQEQVPAPKEEVVDQKSIPSRAQQIARAYHEEVNNPSVSGADVSIASEIGKISQKSIARFGDKNSITSGMAKSYIKKGGEGIDKVAQRASLAMNPNGDGNDISPDQVWEFMKKYPGGANTVYTPAGNPKLKELSDEYSKLTGKGINRRTAKSIHDSLIDSVGIEQADAEVSGLFDSKGELDDAKLLAQLEADPKTFQEKYGLSDEDLDKAKRRLYEQKSNESSKSTEQPDSGAVGRGRVEEAKGGPISLEFRDKAKDAQTAVREITSKPLTHVAGLNMGKGISAGTYVSTEEKNRYGEGKPATVSIKTPFMFLSEDLIIPFRNKVLNDNIADFQEDDFDSFEPFKDNYTLDELSFKGIDRLADLVRAKMQEEGYDSIYLPESTTQEGELIVFDKENVSLSPEATAGEQPKPTTDGQVNQGGQGRQEELLNGPPAAQPPAEGPAAGTPQPAEKQRKFSIQLLDDLDLSSKVKKGLSEDAITYIPKGIQISNAEAQAIVEAKGGNQATKDFLDMTNGMLPDVRVLLGETLIKKYNAEENWDGAILVADNLAKQLTDLGRGVNAAKVYNLLTPDGVIRYVQREITKSRDKSSRDTEPRRKRSKKAVDAENKKAIDKILDPSSPTSKVIIETVKKGKIKQAIDFLEKLKIEEPKGMATAQIVPLGLPIAAWNLAISTIQGALKAGLTISQAVNKALNKLKEKGHTVDEEKFREHFDTALKDFRVTLDPEKAVKEELKSQGKTINDIIRQHYDEQEATKTSLVDKLVKDANVPEDEAKVIADQLVKTIDEMTRVAKEKALKKYLPKAKKGQEAERKTVIDELIEASNVGAMDEDQYRDAISAKLGPKGMTEEQGKQVKILAERIQKAKSDFDRNKAQEDLMRYIDKNIKGIRWTDVGMAIWYANILSGLSTQTQNLYGNLTKTFDDAYTAAVLKPKDAPWIIMGLFQGYGRGMLEAMDVLKSGYQPIKGDVKQIAASSPVLEQVKFKGGAWNPYNYLKYVTRLMGATDIFFYHGLKEMRSRELAVSLAKKATKVNPDKQVNSEAKRLLYGEENAWNEAKDQAGNEGYSGKDQTRRAYELLEKSRPEFIPRDADDAALRGTYNQRPEGALGMLSGLINMASEKFDIGGIKPIKFIVPFTKIIANVANTALDYSPWAFGRYAKGAIGYQNFGENYYHKYSQEEKAKLLVRGITGTLAMAVLAGLTDEEEGPFQITADGTGDMQKNFELQQTGWQPYSIKIGDKWFEYRNTPLAIPFAMVGFWRDGIKYHGRQEDSARLSILMYGTMKYIMDLSFLQSLSSFFDTFSKENAAQGKNFFTKATKEGEKVAKSVVVPNIVTQASRSMQEIMHMPMKQVNGLGDQLVRDMPVLRDGLDNMYNSLGDPVIANQVNKFLPFKMKSEPEGKDKEIYDLIADNGAWIGKPGRGTLKVYDGNAMTDDEFEEFSFRAGKLTKMKIKENLAELKAMKDKEELKDFMVKLKSQARREANIALFGEKSYF